MGLDENKAVYRRFIQEAFNQGNFDNFAELLTPAYEVRDAPPGTPAGAAAVKQIVTMFRTGFPDLEITLDELIAEGDIVCARSTLRGTHKGTIFGIQPTGKSVTMTSLTMVRIEGGRLAESWVKNDVAGLMSQLGAGAPAGASR